jgi:hypothetical protein
VKSVVRAQPSLNPMHRGRLPASSCRHVRVDGLQRPSGRNAYPSAITPSTIMSPARRTAGSWTEIRLGARAHSPTNNASTASVKRYALGPSGDRAPPLALNNNHVRETSRPPTSNQPKAAHARLTGPPCTDTDDEQEHRSRLLLLDETGGLRRAARPAAHRSVGRAPAVLRHRSALGLTLGFGGER